ncbi:hypothetical protein U9M48_022490 [Paspalum notatum var. saurae]|uniref:Uncharacterized protein n=1 Tax=Paspalum notatum var. saurae TaxID=547442 RepID=A0AAQ3TJS8_PASNO
MRADEDSDRMLYASGGTTTKVRSAFGVVRGAAAVAVDPTAPTLAAVCCSQQRQPPCCFCRHSRIAERSALFGVSLRCASLKFVIGDVSAPSSHPRIASASYVNPSAAIWGSLITSCSPCIRIQMLQAMDVDHHDLGPFLDQVVQRPQEDAPPVADLFRNRNEHRVVVELVPQRGARRRGGGAALCAPQRLPRLVLSAAAILHLPTAGRPLYDQKRAGTAAAGEARQVPRLGGVTDL